MPIFRIGAKLLYYAHVPKCAGSSVEDYIQDRFGPLALLDTNFRRVPAARKWTRTSPQHMDAEAFGRLFPDGFFDGMFAVVRHPAVRLRSAYLFQRDQYSGLSRHVSFRRWVDSLEKQAERDWFAYDNHWKPMDAMVPEGATVFRLEDGFDPLIAYFDALEGAASEPRAVARSNPESPARKSSFWRRGPDDLTEALCTRIRGLFPADYDRFGYDTLP